MSTTTKIRATTEFKVELQCLESADGMDAAWRAVRWFDGAPQVFVGNLEQVLQQVADSVRFAERSR